jgi:hypothetical protein
MEPTNTFWQDLRILSDKLPEMSFYLYPTNANNKIVYNYYIDDNKRLKSRGSVQTFLELHRLMNESLKIASPHIMFSPDFPDYLLGEDDPRSIQDSIPYISPEDNASMPHHRSDLWERDYSNYQGVEHVPSPQITWGIVRQEPGVVSGKPWTGTQEMKPRRREMLAIFNPDIKKYVNPVASASMIEKYGRLMKYVEIYGQVYDNSVQYNIWARTSWEVEELTEWFKDYLRKFTGMFREAGIIEMWFDRRVRDDTLLQIKNKYHLRSFLYYFRTEEINIKTIKPIRRIDVNLHVNDLPSWESGNSNDYIVDMNNKLLSKWHSSLGE